jgi:hypothetical protein
MVNRHILAYRARQLRSMSMELGCLMLWAALLGAVAVAAVLLVAR